MTPEEMQRTMQFLLQQQAQFAEDIARIGEKTDQLVGVSRGLADGLMGVTSVVGSLAAAQLRTDGQLRETDRRLSALIDTFERHLRDDHGPRPS